MVLTTNPPDLLKNYFRYESSIERAYNRAVKNLENAIANRDAAHSRLDCFSNLTYAKDEQEQEEAGAKPASAKLYLPDVKRFSTSFQFTTFHQAAR